MSNGRACSTRRCRPTGWSRWGSRPRGLGLRVNFPVSFNIDLEYVLGAFEAIDKEVSIRDQGWVAMHVVEATEEQMERIKALGVHVTISPNFMYLFSDRFRLDRLGARGIPLRELTDAGIDVALETDGVPHSLLWTMWEALERWDARAGINRGDSRLTREEVLHMAIRNGHKLTGNEDRFGSLEVGKSADLVVLDENPLTCPQAALKDIAVDLTLVGGEPVPRRRDGPGLSPAASRLSAGAISTGLEPVRFNGNRGRGAASFDTRLRRYSG